MSEPCHILSIGKEMIIEICSHLTTRSILNLIQCSSHFCVCYESLVDGRNRFIKASETKATYCRGLRMVSTRQILDIPKLCGTIQTKMLVFPDLGELKLLKQINLTQGVIGVGMKFADYCDKENAADVVDFLKSKGKRKILLSLTIRKPGFDTEDGLDHYLSFHYFVSESCVNYVCHSRNWQRNSSLLDVSNYLIDHVNKSLDIKPQIPKCYIGEMVIPKNGNMVNSLDIVCYRDGNGHNNDVGGKIRFFRIDAYATRLSIIASKYFTFDWSNVHVFDSIAIYFISELEEEELDGYNEFSYDGHDSELEKSLADYIDYQYKIFLSGFFPSKRGPFDLLLGNSPVTRVDGYRITVYNCALLETICIEGYMFLSEDDKRENIDKEMLFGLEAPNPFISSFCEAINSKLKGKVVSMDDFAKCKTMYNNFVKHFD